MPVCLILPGKLPPGDPRRHKAIACGFKEQTIWTRPEHDAPKAKIEAPLFKLGTYQFFVHMGDSGPLSVVLSASDECAARLLDCGFEAGTALCKWIFLDEIPSEIRELAITTSWWGMGFE
jgi:hypothetical protein